MQKNKKQNKNREQRCIHRSQWTVNECVNMLAYGMILLVILVIARCSILTCFICPILGIFVGCQSFLRRSYFYDDYMVTVYPLRFRKIIIHYNEIVGFVFRFVPSEGYYLFPILNDSSFLPKIFKKRLSSSKVSPHKNGFFLLKHLKQRGCQIQTNKYDELENRVELVFGSGHSDYIRKSPSEKRKAYDDYRRHIFIVYIAYLLAILLGILIRSHLD
jgi:hypothetical protein